MKKTLLMVIGCLFICYNVSFAGLADKRVVSDGSSAMAFSLSAGQKGTRITQIIVHTSPAVTAAESITCQLNSSKGSGYDGGQISSGSMAGVADWIKNFGDQGGYIIHPGDSFDCSFTNTNTVHWYLTVSYVEE